MDVKVDEELVPKKNATSFVWNYFGYRIMDKEQKNIICKLCKQDKLKAKDGNTSTLRQHLKTHHPKEHAYSLQQGPARVSLKTSATETSHCQRFHGKG